MLRMSWEVLGIVLNFSDVTRGGGFCANGPHSEALLAFSQPLPCKLIKSAGMSRQRAKRPLLCRETAQPALSNNSQPTIAPDRRGEKQAGCSVVNLSSPLS